MKLLLTLLLLTACGEQDVQTDHARSSSTTETETTSTLEGSVTGPKGDTGAQGPKGDKGDMGSTADPIAANLWIDPITKRQWLISTTVFEGTLLSTTPCTDGWILPTKVLAMAAVQHGLLTVSVSMGGPTRVWTSDFQTTFRYCIDINTVATTAGGCSAPNAGIFCLKEI